jgi:hypothetical protein
MPISGIILTIVGVVLLVTNSVHWLIGAACLVIGLGLVGYALTQRGSAGA